MSGNFTPFAKLYGKRFTEESEPESWDKNFSHLYKNYFKGKNLPVKPLDYYFKKEKKTRKALRNLDDLTSFINDNPHFEDKTLFFEVTKNKPKIVVVRNLKKYKRENLAAIPKAIKVEEKKKKHAKRGRKQKIKIVKVRRL